MKYDSFYDFVCHELEELDEKAKADKVSMTDVQYADMLEHYKKSYLTNEAMEESGYSNRYMPNWGGYAYEGNSYAGRMNAKRDSMGRYSRNRGTSYGGNGYSYAEDMEATKDEMRELAQKMPEEHRRKIERALDELR